MAQYLFSRPAQRVEAEAYERGRARIRQMNEEARLNPGPLPTRPLLPPDPVPKEQLYKTARAVVPCAEVRAGELVTIRFSYRSSREVNWYLITSTERGPCDQQISYPQHHLSHFSL